MSQLTSQQLYLLAVKLLKQKYCCTKDLIYWEEFKLLVRAYFSNVVEIWSYYLIDGEKKIFLKIEG